MTLQASALLMTMTLAAFAATGVSAQPVATAAKNEPVVTALMVEVTVSRFQGDKRLSTLPYTIAVTPDGNRATLRVGGSVAIPSVTPTAADAKTPAMMYSYRDIGTSMDVTALPSETGRYRIGVTIEESSVYPADGAVKNAVLVSGAPAFRSFRSSNTLTLRNGQSVEYTIATDRITGETARISVKLTVVD